ncbi:MAG: TadE/TadG family type IV pilus assembly protein [Bacilli bacterium]|nr:TadE/TadG family type IV pilus assembly protein [Bacilli bacterium]
MNKKGQALIEFVLILPVLLLIIIMMIDVGNIFIKKYELNKDLETISDLYQNNENKQLAAYIASEEIKFEEKPVGDMVKLTITKNINIAAPILSNVLGKEYKISLSKMVYASYEGINGQ